MNQPGQAVVHGKIYQQMELAFPGNQEQATFSVDPDSVFNGASRDDEWLARMNGEREEFTSFEEREYFG